MHHLNSLSELPCGDCLCMGFCTSSARSRRPTWQLQLRCTWRAGFLNNVVRSVQRQMPRLVRNYLFLTPQSKHNFGLGLRVTTGGFIHAAMDCASKNIQLPIPSQSTVHKCKRRLPLQVLPWTFFLREFHSAFATVRRFARSLVTLRPKVYQNFSWC